CSSTTPSGRCGCTGWRRICSPGTTRHVRSSGAPASSRRASLRGTSRLPGAGVTTSAGRSPSRTSARVGVKRGWSAPGVGRRGGVGGAGGGGGGGGAGAGVRGGGGVAPDPRAGRGEDHVDPRARVADDRERREHVPAAAPGGGRETFPRHHRRGEEHVDRVG